MMPIAFDSDSNWAIEVKCEAPTFERPKTWPSKCDDAKVSINYSKSEINLIN